MADEPPIQGRRCPQCNADVNPRDDFCEECGARLHTPAVTCPSCGDAIPPGMAFCASCGTPIDAPPVTPEPGVQTAAPPLPAAPTDAHLDSGTGSGSQRFLVPAVIAVVLIGLVGAAVIFGIPALAKGGTNGPSTPTFTPAPTIGGEHSTVSTPIPVTEAATVSAAGTRPSAIKAEFSADRTSGPAPLIVTFTDASTGAPASWYWDFGDGTSSTDRSPVHTFGKGGSYTVTLNIGRDGQTSAKSVSVSVSSLPPVADFQADTTSGTAPLIVTFTDLSTGGPTTWFWEFGNGMISYDRHPRMTFQQPGTYQVRLTIDRGGVKSTKTLEIRAGSAGASTTPMSTAVQATAVPTVVTSSSAPAVTTVSPSVATATSATLVVTTTAPATVKSTTVTTTKSTPKSTTVLPTTAHTASWSFEGEWRDTSGTYFWFQAPEGGTVRGGWEFGEIAGEEEGSFTGTLSNGGKVLSGPFETMFQGGDFMFTLTDANHFTGYMDSPSGKVSLSCSRMGG
jgi:PKD repeat protein/uncharacterized OB-fold protein